MKHPGLAASNAASLQPALGGVIREVVGQIHEELELAGRRYEPSGLASVNYGRALESGQIAMRPLVDSCQTLW